MLSSRDVSKNETSETHGYMQMSHKKVKHVCGGDRLKL